MQSKISTDCTQCFSRNNSVFSICKHDELEKMNDSKGSHVFKKGEAIFSEGEYPKGVYCIFSGSVKVSKSQEDGKEQVVRLIKGGNILGYRSLLCDEKYQASAYAMEDTRVCFFPKEFYLQMLNENPALSRGTIKLLTSDLRHAENMVIELIHKSAKARIAEALLMLEKFYGANSKDGFINIVLKREDVANIAGTTTETAIRALSDWAKEGLILLEGKRIKIEKKNMLSKMAENVS